MNIDSLFDHIDLTGVHTIATTFGMAGCVYVMQLTEKLNVIENPIIAFLQRAAFTLIGLSMFWSYWFSQDKGWQPWAPDLGIIVAVDVMLVIRAISLHLWNRKPHKHS